VSPTMPYLQALKRSGARTGERWETTARGSGADVCRGVSAGGGGRGWRDGLGACAAAMSANPAAAAAKARVLNGFSVRDRRCVSGAAESLDVTRAAFVSVLYAQTIKLSAKPVAHMQLQARMTPYEQHRMIELLPTITVVSPRWRMRSCIA